MIDLSKREFFDKEACGWDDRYHRADRPEIRQLSERFDLKPGDRILEVETGNGILFPYLLEKVKDRGRIVDQPTLYLARARR